MAQEKAESKDLKGLSETIKFCAGVGILLFAVWFFENDLSHSFVAFAVPGALMTLLFIFVICLVASLIYASKFKKLSWVALLPLSINIMTAFSIVYLAFMKNGILK